MGTPDPPNRRPKECYFGGTTQKHCLMTTIFFYEIFSFTDAFLFHDVKVKSTANNIFFSGICQAFHCVSDYLLIW